MKDSTDNLLSVWSHDPRTKSLDMDYRSTKASLRNKVRHLINQVIELRECAPSNLHFKIDEIDGTVHDITHSVEGYVIDEFAINKPGDVTPMNAKQMGGCCCQR